MSEQQPLRLQVHPVPTDAEAAAISAAATTAIAVEAPPTDVRPVKNAWREAGKRESLRDSQWETEN